MKSRCLNPKSARYNCYGGRGIKVCDRWLESFENFYTDMLSTWKQGLTLERINNDGNYEPSNCKWATLKEQGNNRSTNTKITYKGRTQNISEWAREYGIKNPGTLSNRVFIHKWDIEKALTTPVKNYKRG